MSTLQKKQQKQPNKTKKKFIQRTLRVFSRHPSHSILRRQGIITPVLSCIRMGSTTRGTLPYKVEINSVESIKNSSNKLLMKRCFSTAQVKTPQWVEGSKFNSRSLPFEFPIVAKHIFGSRGTGNTLINNQKELDSWLRGKTLSNYIFEKFYNYGLEFRLHITERGCFYTCRKALKQDCPESEKWRHHDDNCVWFTEQNASFFKPNSWNDIVKDCVKALKAVGADVLSFDVKVQTAKDPKKRNRDYQDYILIECNSASSFGNITAQKYIQEIPKIISHKLNK